jgi:hypothetical protein
MGLFGRTRKRDLWETLGGLDEGTYEPAHSTAAEASRRPVGAGIGDDPSIGDPSGRPERKFNWGNAALGFFGGQGAVNYIQNKHAQEDEQAAFEQKQGAIRAAQQSAFEYLTKTAGMDPRAAQAMSRDPQIVAQFAKEAYAPQHFGAEGGSLYDRATDKWTTAPSERQIGRNVFRFGQDGQQQQIHSEVEPQSVPGVGLYGWDGTKGGIQGAGQGQQPQGGGALTDEDIERMERGGAGQGGPGTFRKKRLFGRGY